MNWLWWLLGISAASWLMPLVYAEIETRREVQRMRHWQTRNRDHP